MEMWEDKEHFLSQRPYMEKHVLLNDFTGSQMLDCMGGLKGHRSVGGYRASMYNAMPITSVEVLVEVMKELESKKG